MDQYNNQPPLKSYKTRNPNPYPDERFKPPDQCGHYEYQNGQFCQKNNPPGRRNNQTRRNEDDDMNYQGRNDNYSQNQFRNQKQREQYDQRYQDQQCKQNYDNHHNKQGNNKKNNNFQNKNPQKNDPYLNKHQNQQEKYIQKEEFPKQGYQNWPTNQEKTNNDKYYINSNLNNEMYATDSQISNSDSAQLSQSLYVNRPKQENQISFELNRSFQQIQLDDFNYLLDQVIGLANVQVVINNPTQQLIDHLSQLRVNIEIKGINQPNYPINTNKPINQNQPNYPNQPPNQSQYPTQPTGSAKSKIVIEEVEEEFIYQIEPQEINSVSAEMKMIILHKMFLPQCLKNANEQQLVILINASEYQYKIEQKIENGNPQICKQAFIQFSKLLNSFQIVVYECQSIEEAKAIQYILQIKPIKEKLEQALNVSHLEIEGTQNLEEKDYKNAKDLLESVKNIKASQPMIFGIIQNSNQNKLKENQQKFKSFIKDERYILKIKEEQKIQMGELPDVEQLKQKLQNEKLDGFEILISDPNYNPKIKQYMIEVQYLLWMPGTRKESEGQEQMNKIKEFVHSILNPTISFTIDDQKQIKLWKFFLVDKYTNLDQVKVQSAKVNNSLQIRVQGLESSTREIETKIRKDLQNYKLELFDCSNFGSKESFQILAKKNIEKIFTKTIEQLINPLPIVHSKFKILKIKPESEQIQFSVVYDSTQIELAAIQDKIEKGFVSKINSMEVEIKFREFLNEKGLGDDSFENLYEVYVRSVKNNKFLFISILSKLDQLADQLNSFKANQQAKLKTIIIREPNLILLNKIEEFEKNKKIIIHKDIKITFSKEQNQIEITGSEKEAKQLESEIKKIQQSLASQLITTPLQLNEKEANFILKYHQQKLKQLQTQYNLQIQENHLEYKHKQSRNSQFTCQLQYQGKTLFIAYADIAKIECDAIVNSCNQLMSFGDSAMSSGVAKRIQEVFGQSYINFCEDYINQFQLLDYGRVATYKTEGNSYCRYVMNVQTPYYSKGQQVGNDSQIILLNISNVFKEANKLKLKSLAFPIFGGGAAGYFFKQLVTQQLESVFSLFFESPGTVQQIYITELDQEKINVINETLQTILQPTSQQWKSRYQWQWKDNSGFVNYDDESINEQIDKAYATFLQDPQQNQVKLVFPFTKQPGTHRVDFAQNTLTDISLNKTQKITIQVLQQKRRYCFDNKPVDDILNEFLELQFQNKIQKFDIFYKRHKVVFVNDQIVQVNEETGYQRSVQCLPYTQKQQKQQNCLVNKTFQLDFFKNTLRNTSLKRNTNSLSIISFDNLVAEKIQNQLLQIIQDNIVQVQIQIPNLKSKDLDDLSDIIRQYSIKELLAIGSVGPMNVQVFKKKAQKFQKLLNDQIQKISKYPKEWDLQTQNFLKVEIQPNTKEFQEIAGEFKKTGKGQIYAIYRIQNQKLYENYISEKKRLEEIATQRNLPPLTTQEKERYLWHGVRGSHPKIIYESLKEAFDFTYSNSGMWGQGIYFAEQAEYSRNYSYTLQASDSQQHAGRLIFLCCKVCTGRLFVSKPDQTLRHPPDGFDAVQGFTNESNVFILYGMDVRRAYPAYEVIYK